MGWESQSPTLTSTRSVVVQTTEYKYTHTTTVICTKDVVHTKYCLCVCYYTFKPLYFRNLQQK